MDEKRKVLPFDRASQSTARDCPVFSRSTLFATNFFRCLDDYSSTLTMCMSIYVAPVRRLVHVLDSIEALSIWIESYTLKIVTQDGSSTVLQSVADTAV